MPTSAPCLSYTELLCSNLQHCSSVLFGVSTRVLVLTSLQMLPAHLFILRRSSFHSMSTRPFFRTSASRTLVLPFNLLPNRLTQNLIRLLRRLIPDLLRIHRPRLHHLDSLLLCLATRQRRNRSFSLRLLFCFVNQGLCLRVCWLGCSFLESGNRLASCS